MFSLDLRRENKLGFVTVMGTFLVYLSVLSDDGDVQSDRSLLWQGWEERVAREEGTKKKAVKGPCRGHLRRTRDIASLPALTSQSQCD